MRTLISTIALVSLVLGIAPIAMATPDSNFIVQDNIEYYMQVNKPIYDLGEDVAMLYRVTNLGVGNVTFTFTSGPLEDRCDYIVEKDGDRIWDNIYRPSTGVITSLTLSSLESREFTHTWDMTNFGGYQVMPGDYDITGALSDLMLEYAERYVPVSVSIGIIPEPASLLLLGTGFLGLILKGSRK